MKAQRAQEILEAPGKIQVNHQGEPVWIDSVDLQDHTAAVHPEEQPSSGQKIVPVEELQEV